MSRPNILLLDIETFPNTGFAWGKWEQDIIDFVDHWYILCFGYQWYGRKGGAKVISISDQKNYQPRVTRDEKIIHDLWHLLDEADVVVAHNAKQFDIRKIFTRMIQHGLGPPSRFSVVDTLKEARKFAFNSSKLDDVGRDTNLGRKMAHTGFPLWLACHNGDPKAWVNMKKYNKQDVILLKKWFKKVLPWIGYLGAAGTPYVKPKKII